jgi:hypothetical protein
MRCLANHCLLSTRRNATQTHLHWGLKHRPVAMQQCILHLHHGGLCCLLHEHHPVKRLWLCNSPQKQTSPCYYDALAKHTSGKLVNDQARHTSSERRLCNACSCRMCLQGEDYSTALQNSAAQALHSILRKYRMRERSSLPALQPNRYACRLKGIKMHANGINMPHGNEHKHCPHLWCWAGSPVQHSESAAASRRVVGCAGG